ncbi:hypothetical protein OKW98_10910 [Pseudomonas sp. KU26590]|uniref:hypothetical protein n=1 Tax=Pseudomonas sp. KU26590 TaxID=2991051 RepID=UPI00223DCBE0|nr:hypothetical protein [Pseudomonas sp. KU26590]UZJ62178.1 hypothetical protein OKW98_10910 [Pseudomonas sp. KU26590]
MKSTGLVAPSIPVAAIDGLIPLADLTRDISVVVETWTYSDEGDVFQLMINGIMVGPIQTMPVPLPAPGTLLSLTLPIEQLENDGSYEVAYTVTNMTGGITVESPSTTIRVDRTKPGATLLAPLIFPTATFGDQLIGLLPGYAGMAPGDVIQTLLNGVAGPAHQVQAEELTLRSVEITFSREHLQALAAENVSIEYFVTDRAGNVSITSLPTLVSLKL